MIRHVQTGDEAVMDADGYIKITGRIKDIIIRGGENIHPLEIENCLFAHASVAEASVVGVPDERYGEVVAAFVIPVVGRTIEAEEIKRWVRERLSHHLGEFEIFFFQGYVHHHYRQLSRHTRGNFLSHIHTHRKLTKF